MKRQLTIAGIPIFITFKDGKMLDVPEPLYEGDIKMPKKYITDIVDQLRMIAGLSPNLSPEDAAVINEAADLIERMRVHKKKQSDDRR
jgi:hypothetical protein